MSTNPHQPGESNLATWSIRNPIPATLFFILLTLAGLWGFRVLGIQDFPDLDLPAVNVVIRLPGAAPSQLETEVAKKVEDKIATLQGLNHQFTSITDGEVSINVQFKLERDLSDALIDVRDAVDSVRGDLPADIDEPQVSKVTVGPGGPTLTYAVTHTGMDEEALSWFTDDRISRAVLAVKGVGRFSRVGGVQREIQVELDPARLAATGATVPDVSRALRRVQQESSGGRAPLSGLEQGVRTVATVATAADLYALPVALADGRSLRMDQVARVRDTITERSQAALLDGVPALGFHVYRARGQDETRIDDGVKQAVLKLEAAHPGLRFHLVATKVDHTREQYRGSMVMLYEGAILTVLVIWWFLRDMRATIIGAIALPLSILPTFAFMHFMGYSLNTITLLALAVVVGILVDDAIVEVENIARHARQGLPIRQATENAVNEIWLAVLATTLALVVVFLPTAFMSGIPGLVFKQFGWTVVVAVLASLVVARIATPMLCAWFLKSGHQPAEDSRLMREYLKVVRWALRHRGWVLLATLLLFASSLALVPLLPMSFVPASDKGRLTIDMELPPGSSLASTLESAEAARSAFADVAGIRSVFVTACSPHVAGGHRGGGGAGEVRKANLEVVLQDRDARAPLAEIEREVRRRLANVPGIRWSISGGGPGEKLQLILASADGNALKEAALRVEAEMRGLTYLSGLSSTASLERPELVIRPDLALAAERGVTTQALGELVRIATSGDFTAALAKLNLDQRQVDIRARVPDSVRSDVDAIGALKVQGRGGLVPLQSVAALSLESGPHQINRYDRERNVTLSADLAGFPLGDALAEARALPSVRALPQGVRLLESGDAEVMRDLFGGFLIALVVGVLCKYCVLVVLFKDWLQPITILSVLPMCIGGAFVALLAFGGHLSLPSLIGLVMLFGIVTKNSILVIEYAILARRDHGLGEEEALIDACNKRARPVMMTTIAMIAGMLPMSFGLGGDGSFRQPMAIAVIGGLISSTALSLIVVPVFSVYMSRIAAATGHLFGRLGWKVLPQN